MHRTLDVWTGIGSSGVGITVDLNEAQIDLFSSLLQFQPTELRSSQENFLSELFGYVLRTSEGARDAWVSFVLGRTVHCEVFDITTRATERCEETRDLFPDLKIEGILIGGQRFAIISEHKEVSV